MAELTQKQLEELYNGKPSMPRAAFYEQAVLNVEQSQQAGHRVYDKKVYVQLNQPGVTDTVSYEAQRADIEHYDEEYKYFLRTKQGTQMPGIEIIPNLDLAHLQELRDMKVLTIPQLAALETVPYHLEYARQAAIVFNKALEETSHAKQEENQQESRGQAQAVPPQNRPEHRGDVRRPEVPRSNGHGEIREVAQRHAQGGREHHHQGVNWAEVRIA